MSAVTIKKNNMSVIHLFWSYQKKIREIIKICDLHQLQHQILIIYEEVICFFLLISFKTIN